MKNEIGFIAIGQAGGNIGQLLETIGYNVLYINSSKEDLDTLRKAKFKYHIKDGQGSNKDREKAKDLLTDDYANIEKEVSEKMKENMIFVIFSAGGGTGSGASPMLIQLLIEHTRKKIGAITILPSKDESPKTFINTLQCFNELEQVTDIGATFVLDNNKGDKININKTFVELFDSFLNINKSTSLKGNIDKSEIQLMLQTKGASIIIKNNRATDATAEIISSLKKNIFANIEEDKVVSYMAISTSAKIEHQSLVTEVGLFLDTFRGYNNDNTICMLSGLTFPYTYTGELKDFLKENVKILENSLLSTSKSRLGDDDNVNFLGNFLVKPKIDKSNNLSISATFEKFKRK